MPPPADRADHPAPCGKHIKGLGKLRYVVEQTFALLHQFRRLAIRWERRLDIHEAFVSLGCALICRVAAGWCAGTSQRSPWRSSRTRPGR